MRDNIFGSNLVNVTSPAQDPVGNFHHDRKCPERLRVQPQNSFIEVSPFFRSWVNSSRPSFIYNVTGHQWYQSYLIWPENTSFHMESFINVLINYVCLYRASGNMSDSLSSGVIKSIHTSSNQTRAASMWISSRLSMPPLHFVQRPPEEQEERLQRKVT